MSDLSQLSLSCAFYECTVNYKYVKNEINIKLENLNGETNFFNPQRTGAGECGLLLSSGGRDLEKRID
jgi:hypothetical protein